ncbi:trypsin-like peptidase domain-containing protein [Streptomyces sp. NPDC085931]|uniref:S1C family serine protease n=1 Tax=Streptomyces sp. NPDC085931 TaxID=3365740 RepID=UPI0037D629A3
MNEGKPTKAKWWNRPRPQDPEGADPAADEARGRAQTPAASADTEGDFELARPEPRRDEETGDYELRRPDAPTTDRSAPDERAGDAPQTATAGAGAEGDASAVAASAGAGAEGGSSAVAVSGPAVPAVPAQEARKPLHDPDPYSTPPYGEPGPWAPAPPVQHPAATPAHGVAAPAPAMPMPGTPGAPAAHGASMTPPSPGFQAPGAAASAVPAADTATSALPASAPYAPPHSGPAPIPERASQPQASQPQGTLDPAPAPIPAPALAAAPAPAPDPWRRYDPWAAPGPLQQAGPLQQTGAPGPGSGQRRGRGRKTLVLGAVVLALVSGGIGGLVGTYLERNGGVGTVELPQAGKEAAGRDADSVAGIAGRALPSVVTLHVSGSGEQGTGTGFVLDTRGHILTNNHVVRPAGTNGEITVTFNGGETAEAELVGRDSGYDLAVVKVKGVSGLTPLPLGNSDSVQVGDPVVAIGAPFDLAGTVTSGIISAKQRPITAGGEKGDGSDVSYVDALQTDAPINPGNSGGPLLDSRARVIGINSAIRSADSGSDPDSGQSGSIGLGFAIPINQGKRVAEELINTGKATHPVIGITLDMDFTGDGARVDTEGGEGGPPVTAGGPGARAGIKAGDVITEVDGRRIHSGEELIVKTRAHRPGDRLELTVERGGKERTVSLVLGSSGG